MGDARGGTRFPLLAPALEGLARYAHLMGVEYFADLLAALERLLAAPGLPLRARLACLLAACELLRCGARRAPPRRPGGTRHGRIRLRDARQWCNKLGGCAHRPHAVACHGERVWGQGHGECVLGWSHGGCVWGLCHGECV